MNKQDQDTRNPSSAMPHSRAWLAVLVAGAALTLAACDKSDNRSAGEKLDSAVAKTEQAAETAAAKTGEAVKEAKAKVEASGTTAEMKEGMANAKEAAKNAGAAVSATVDDAAITASVSAGLAKDPDLSAIKINVDTKGGAVSLKGPAPTVAAKARAEEIAKGVQGVTSVDNQLEVKS
ncbi:MULTISPECIES: BON domain-containing protein [unclassified Variovorax]|jgi:hyperosmotically inducible protein|uniref:BON domain-containing protein n=1 Tax=unclassified Variovorax TaxID=663243 RepID=UPI0008B88240|nr:MULTISPECIES: BON domain-containing protein [unclassified Variovorax]SEK13621.1 BON domain-containing protein [Variovorax sp. OK202]SFD89891.1 BON domain-containing protein [Variovorax sp. OK212]